MKITVKKTTVKKFESFVISTTQDKETFSKNILNSHYLYCEIAGIKGNHKTEGNKLTTQRKGLTTTYIFN